MVLNALGKIKSLYLTALRLGMEFLDWPAKSPDPNSIEDLWIVMKRNISSQIIARSVGDLEKQLLNEQWSIPQETINSLIDTIPSRVQAVIDSHRGPTKQ